MKLDVFKEVVRLLKSQSDRDSAIYGMGVDLSEFESPLQWVISHLIGSIYGKEGKETFEWWCYDKEWGTKTEITMTDVEGNLMCETIEDLHQYLEDTIVLDYELPKKYTDDERISILKKMFE